MMLGLSLSAFTTLHVVISLIAMVAGIPVVAGLLSGVVSSRWTAFFFATTILTSVTGFMFPASRFLPSHLFGLISLAVLAAAIIALYAKHLAGFWRPVYVGAVLLGFYLNVFVGVFQAFLKLSPLQALAPTQSEAPFAAAHLLVLAGFIVLGFLAIRRFKPVI